MYKSTQACQYDYVLSESKKYNADNITLLLVNLKAVSHLSLEHSHKEVVPGQHCTQLCEELC